MATQIGSGSTTLATYIPDLADTANIQTALKQLYYGTTGGTLSTTTGIYGALYTLYTGNPTLAGNVTITGTLTVNGTTTTVNSTTLTIDDKNIVLGNDNTLDTQADGGGITLNGTTAKTFQWADTGDNWTSSENLSIATGKTYKINNADIVSGSATALVVGGGASTTIAIGANGGTATILNPTVTLTNATALNLNGASPSIVTSSNGTASVFNTNALSLSLGNAATTANLVNSATTLNIGNTTYSAQTVNMFTASTGASTYNFATGAQGGGTIKTLNIGTGAGTGGTTNINIGGNPSVSTSNINLNGTLTLNGTIADATTTTAARGIGYMGLPQNSTTTGSYTIVAGDAGEHIYASATRTVTIPANGSVAFPVGTTLTFIAGAGATMTIAITTDTMYLAGSGTTGSRTLAAHGIATAVKTTATTWLISGNGLT